MKFESYFFIKVRGLSQGKNECLNKYFAFNYSSSLQNNILRFNIS